MDKKPENIGDLGEFFNIIGKAKKQKEDEFRSVVGDINLDGIFDNLKEENKKIKKKKKKEKKQIEQLKIIPEMSQLPQLKILILQRH